MEFREEKRLVIEMTEEERQAVLKVVDMLSDLEMEFCQEELEPLQNYYEEYLDGVPHNTALPTTIDFLGMLVEKR